MVPVMTDTTTPIHPHLLTHGRNRGKTELVTQPDGSTYHRKPAKPRAPKPPRDRKVLKAALAYVALRAEGQSTAVISEQLQLPKATLQQYVKIARKRGWLK